MKIAFGIVGGLVGILALTWIFQGNDFFLYKFWAPKQEAVRREVFEQSKAYNTGMVQELENMQYEYAKATPEQKAAMKGVFLHRSADYPVDKMPTDLRLFIQGLKSETEVVR